MHLLVLLIIFLYEYPIDNIVLIGKNGKLKKQVSFGCKYILLNINLLFDFVDPNSCPK